MSPLSSTLNLRKPAPLKDNAQTPPKGTNKRAGRKEIIRVNLGKAPSIGSEIPLTSDRTSVEYPRKGQPISPWFTSLPTNAMGCNFGYYRTDKGAIKVSVWSVGVKPTVVINAGVIPGLIVEERYWHRGQLTRNAPPNLRATVDAYTTKLAQLNTALITKPQPLSKNLIREVLNPTTVDLWAMLETKLHEWKGRNTSTFEVYRWALQSYRAYVPAKEQPSEENWKEWTSHLGRTRSPRTVNVYTAGVRSLLSACPRRLVTFDTKGQRVKEKPHEGIALTPAEVTAISQLDLSHSIPLARTRDAFLMACNTALRRCDWHHFKAENVGFEVINKKTKKFTPIPDTALIVELIRRNGGAIVTSKGVNVHMKRIARLSAEVCPSLLHEVVINGKRKKRWECVSSHVARRTFVSVGLDNGIPPERLIELTGHSSLAQLLAYYRSTLSFTERMNRARDTVEAIYATPPLRVVNE